MIGVEYRRAVYTHTHSPPSLSFFYLLRPIEPPGYINESRPRSIFSDAFALFVCFRGLFYVTVIPVVTISV